MPSPILVPAITAAASLLGTGATAYAQGKMNKKTRKWNEKMYAQQRQDSLADWAMQNEYNSPDAVMQRLRKAGLNPNLVYGEGANMPAAQVKSSQVESWNPKAPDIDLSGVGNGLMSYYDIKMKEAQTNNLNTQNTVMEQEKLLKAAQTGNLLQNTAKTKFDLDLATELKTTTIEQALANLKKTQADTATTLDENERRAALTAQSLTKGVEEILNMKKQRAKTDQEIKQIKKAIELMEKDKTLKQLEINLREKGINPNDPMWLRIIGQAVERFMNGDSIIPMSMKPGSNNPLYKIRKKRGIYDPAQIWDF